MSVQQTSDPPAAGRYRTTDDVAAKFHVSTQTVLEWRAAGKLPGAVKVGRRWLWPEAALDAMPSNQEVSR